MERTEHLKRCWKCKTYLAVTLFTGRQKLCRPCRAEHDRLRPDRTNGSKFRNVTDAARERKRRWAVTHKDPIKYAARQAVHRAIRRGELQRPSACSKCGRGAFRIDGASAIQAHHHAGYDKPLDVVWLCAACHKHDHAAIQSRKEGESDPRGDMRIAGPPQTLEELRAELEQKEGESHG